MSSKARFDPKAAKTSSKGSGNNVTKVGSTTSATVIPGSKAQSKYPQSSGFEGKKSGNNIQVIFNGKIVTPQSLIQRKPFISGGAASKSENQNNVQTIDENVAVKAQASSNNLSIKAPAGRSASVMIPSNSSFMGKKNVKEEFCTVNLEETSTITTFFLSSMIVASDLREVDVMDKKNAKYEAVVDFYKAGDGFSHRLTQTLNQSQKNQNEMAAPNALRDMGCQAMAYDITDCTGANNRVTDTNDHSIGVGTDTLDLIDEAGLTLSVRKFVTDTVNVSLVSPGCLLDVNDVSRPIGPNETSKHESGTRAKKSSNQQTSQIGGSSVGIGGTSGVNINESFSGHPVQNVSQTQQASGTIVEGSGSKIMGEPTGDPNYYPMEQDSSEILRVKEATSILSSKLLLKRLQMLERAVQQNAYHRQQLDYQSLPDVPPISLLKAEQKKDESADQLFGGLGGGFGSRKPKGEALVEEVVNVKDDELVNSEPKKIKKLFSFFYSDLVQGRSVTSMVWNSVNSDLLAVGYGKIDNFVDNSKVGEAVDEENQGGLVLFWSLRNPEYPEKILRTRFPVTSVDFSKLSPMLLAVGLINGDVNIYDIKRETDWETPVESSNGMHGSHSDPVWTLKWIIKGVERFETLVSISTDGKVLEWSIKKGLVVSTLMQLNRSGSGEGWISRQAAGLGFNFLPNDLNTYIVGTEEGAIHKCSVSYNEQYLDTYEGHEGPVYRIKFSQKWPSIFLSCSADWTIGLYHVKAKAPLLRMRATGEDFAINDIAWCPGNSTVFATVTADAKLQIWDLSVSVIDPVVTVDTNNDEESTEVEEIIIDGERINTAGSSVPPTPAHTTSRFDRFGTEKEEIKETSLQKLLKNLSKENGKRVLSCLLFGEKSPTIVVGDNKGAVTVYRVIDPITITNEGPIQQGQKLKNAISSQSDPTNAAKLAAVEEEEKDGKNTSH